MMKSRSFAGTSNRGRVEARGLQKSRKTAEKKSRKKAAHARRRGPDQAAGQERNGGGEDQAQYWR